MAVFAEGCTMDSIEGVCGGPPLERTGILTLLSSLVEKSLVLGDPAGESMVYRLLESTRCYALEKLQASGEREALERRLAMWIANIRAS
jgi:predicted ATPase